MKKKLKKKSYGKLKSAYPKLKKNGLHYDLNYKQIVHNYIEGIGKYTIFNVYCYNKQQTTTAKKIINKYQGVKYFYIRE